MAKKHFIRYNPVADRIEAFSGKRPKGSGWKQVDVDKCCNVPSFLRAGCTYESIAVAATDTIVDDVIPNPCTITIQLMLDGIAVGPQFSDSNSMSAILDAANTYFAGFAHFSFDTASQKFKVLITNCNPYTIDVDVNCER